MGAADSETGPGTRRPAVAILAPGGQGEALAQGLKAQGLRTLVVDLDEAVDGRLAGRAQILLVDLCAAPDNLLDTLDQLTETAAVPILFNETELAGRPRAWLKRLARKLEALAAPLEMLAEPEPDSQRDRGGVADYSGPMVWVLGASFGGPEAVKRFLDSMPGVPPAYFLLAQHIGDGFVDLLASQLNRSTRFRVLAAADGLQPEPGTIHVAPVASRIHFDETASLRLRPDPSPPLYRPSIDALLEEVAHRFGPMAGAIVFSGMGDDGARGVQAVAQAGGEVWAQDSDSCTISSMPDCAAATGVVRRRGTPEQLSAALMDYLHARESARAAQ